MSYLTRGRSFAVIEEAAYATPNPTFASADYVDYTSGEMSTDVEKIEREVLRQSLLKLESILGQETSSGNITVELSSKDASTGINGDLLFKNGIGQKLVAVTATDIASATDATSFAVSDATGLELGQVLKIDVTGGITGGEYVSIASISGTDITVAPALSATPSAADAVEGLDTYILPKPDTDVPSLAVREHLAPTSGNTVDYDYLGVVVSEVSLDFPVGGIATAAFTLAGAGYDATTPGSTVSLPCSTLTPIVGKNASVVVLGNTYTAQDLSVKITTEITDVKSITTDGITNKIGVAKTVTGSFKTEYTGTTNFEAFKNGTKGALSMLLKDGGASSPVIVGVIAPSIKFTNVGRVEDGGILYDQIEFEILSPSCEGNERGISVFVRENS
jgi:hypothetical protein